MKRWENWIYLVITLSFGGWLYGQESQQALIYLVGIIYVTVVFERKG